MDIRSDESLPIRKHAVPRAVGVVSLRHDWYSFSDLCVLHARWNDIWLWSRCGLSERYRRRYVAGGVRMSKA